MPVGCRDLGISVGCEGDVGMWRFGKCQWDVEIWEYQWDVREMWDVEIWECQWDVAIWECQWDVGYVGMSDPDLCLSLSVGAVCAVGTGKHWKRPCLFPCDMRVFE